MAISTSLFKIVDKEKDCYRIKIDGRLTGAETDSLREEIDQCVKSDYDVIYIDAKDVTEADLSGINEIIHSHYTLSNVAKEAIFLYRKNSPVDVWVETTGLDKFMATAIVPAGL